MYIGKKILSKCKRVKSDIQVQNGLCVTPSKMLEMASHGVPISVQNEQNFYDGVPNPSWEVLPEKVRGVDANDLWLLQKTSRNKLRSSKRTNPE